MALVEEKKIFFNIPNGLKKVLYLKIKKRNFIGMLFIDQNNLHSISAGGFIDFSKLLSLKGWGDSKQKSVWNLKKMFKVKNVTLTGSSIVHVGPYYVHD